MASILSRDFWVGDPARYNYLSLCRCNNPCGKKEKDPINFYSKDEPLPIFLSMLMGLQHAFAMVGGLITPPFVVFRFTISFTDTEAQQYAISAALIASGICSLINITQIPIPFSEKIFNRKLFIGSGVLSVMGTSFTFLPIFEIAIGQMMDEGVSGFDAYGRMLGTVMVCGLLELCLSILPIKIIKTIFPPLVSSITVILIGAALTGTGMRYWGGGVVCADMVWKDHAQVRDSVGFPPAPVYALPGPTCANGEVNLGYGSAEFIGLGFSVMVFLVFIEFVGSTFMKNCNVILALLFGYFVAGVSNYDGLNYVDSSKIADAAPITFLWVKTFPLGFYAPAVIPCLIAYLVTTTETVGDITATFEVSQLETEGVEYEQSIQGGLMSDSVCSILSGLFTSMPNTTFSQNNGVIALTKCASRRAGLAAGCWLIFLGVFSKVAGVITSIPDCVLGGMTIFLFANVLVSGIALTRQVDIHSRRVKFIMALSLAIGLGVTIWPFAFADMRGSSQTAHFWSCEDCSSTLRGVRNGVSIFLSTGYCIGTVIAVILNLILPEDAPVVDINDMDEYVTGKEIEDGAPEDEKDDLKKETTEA